MSARWTGYPFEWWLTFDDEQNRPFEETLKIG